MYEQTNPLLKSETFSITTIMFIENVLFTIHFCLFDTIYDFRHCGYIGKNILEIFLREYLKELFRYYEHYINETEIEEHLQKVINT